MRALFVCVENAGRSQIAQAVYERRGGEALPVTASDLRTLAALRVMFERRPQGLHQWLRERKPASSMEIFSIVLAGVRENSAERIDSPGPYPTDHDAILVDTLATYDQVDALADWIDTKGRRLSRIYITHGHGDHWLGLARLIQRFPGAKGLATSEVLAQAADPGMTGSGKRSSPVRFLPPRRGCCRNS